MKFGPAGNSDRFYAEGYKSSLQAPARLAAQGFAKVACFGDKAVEAPSDQALRVHFRALKPQESIRQTRTGACI